MPEKKNSQRLTKPEKLRNARLCNNDKSTFHLPRQGKWTTCNSGINGAKWGDKSDDSATELPADYF